MTWTNRTAARSNFVKGWWAFSNWREGSCRRPDVGGLPPGTPVLIHRGSERSRRLDVGLNSAIRLPPALDNFA